MKKIISILLIIFISYSFEDRMRCFDDLDGSPTEKCYIHDEFNDLRYYDSCKNGKICTVASPIDDNINSGNFYIYQENRANYGVCAPLPFGGFEGSVCGDNAECFSNNCDGTKCGAPAEFCKMHSECEKGQYCSLDIYDSNSGTKIFEGTHECKDLSKEGGECYSNFMCPPLYLCNRLTTSAGKCEKIGSNEDGPVSNKLLCKTGYANSDGYCIKTANNVNCVNGNPSGDVTFSDSSTTYYFGCRRSLIDDSSIPEVDSNSINAFKEYAEEVGKTEVKIDKKHANYGYIRYHYDKKKLKEKLIKAMYPELTKDDDTAECLLDVVKQLQLSGEKIKFSSLLVFAFAVLLL